MKLETVFRPDADVGHFTVTYPTGGATATVTLSVRCTTHAALIAHIVDALNTAIGSAVLTGDVSGIDGTFRIDSTGSNFDLTVHPAMQTFLSWSATYTDVAGVLGGAFPPSQFRPAAPLERPHPWWSLDRSGVESDHGRVEGVLRAMLPYQPLRLVFDSDDWAGLVAWLEHYTLRHIPFSLFRATDSTLYCLTDVGAVNADGRSVCVLEAGAEVARKWFTGRAQVRGYIALEPRIIEGV